MEKIQLAALVLFLITVAGCRKIYDRLFPGHDHDKTCRIKTTSDGAVTYNFYYSSNGNLDSAVAVDPPENSLYFTYLFNYDNDNKLTEFKTVFPGGDNTDIYYWHKYKYSGDLIVSDSVTRFSVYEIYSHLYSYDSQGRLSKERRYLLFSGPGDDIPPDSTMFTYNAQGNLLAPANQPAYHYDNKRNLASINKVVQFTSQNYSVNNYTAASQYNSEQLPLKFDEPYRLFYDALGGFGQTSMMVKEVTYECK